MARTRAPHSLVLFAAVGAVLAGCASAEPAPVDDVLDIAFTADMAPPDPDTEYQLHGNTVTMALYEGLLEYSPTGSDEIVGLLADSWTVSDDGLVYTFTLKPDLTFADGSTLDSTALLAGFERRADEAVGSPMSYMLLPVAGYETPDPQTFVINLAYPESAFLSYLASPFSPKAVNPAVLEEHADDAALGYLQSASAGSGPYVLESFEPGQGYVLAANENYWGDAPGFDTVEISIMPDPASQVLALESGDIDIVMNQPIATIDTFAESDSIDTVSFPALQKTWIGVNTGSDALADVATRTALRAAIDRDALVDQVWGEWGSASTQLYPTSMLAPGTGLDEWEFDPSLVAEAAPSSVVTIAYTAGGTVEQQVAEALQAQFDSAGVATELSPVQDADIYSFAEDLAAAPELYIQSSFPDSTHPDTWARLFWYHDVASGFGGFLNTFVAGTAEADALMDQGLASIDEAEVAAAYDEVARILHEQVGYITLNDTQDIFLVRDGLSGIGHWLPAPTALDIATITAE